MSSVDTSEVQVRVRYVECDPMNVAHHSVYPVWLEIARTELLREQGKAYSQLEAQDVLFVVARMSLRYLRPAMYDDVLTVRCKAVVGGRAKIDHEYEIFRDGRLITRAQTTLVCVDRDGRPRALPDVLLMD